jgi:hypothetical protein
MEKFNGKNKPCFVHMPVEVSSFYSIALWTVDQVYGTISVKHCITFRALTDPILIKSKIRLVKTAKI